MFLSIDLIRWAMGTPHSGNECPEGKRYKEQAARNKHSFVSEWNTGIGTRPESDDSILVIGPIVGGQDRFLELGGKEFACSCSVSEFRARAEVRLTLSKSIL